MALSIIVKFFKFILLLLNIKYASSRIYSQFDKLSVEEVKKYAKPTIAPQFFSKFTLATERWLLIEENNYTQDTCLPQGGTLTKITDPLYKWYGPNSETSEVDDDRVRGYDNGQVEIRHPSLEDTGYYVCEITSRTESDVRVTYKRFYAVFFTPKILLVRHYYMRSSTCDEQAYTRWLGLAIKTFCKGSSECEFKFTRDTCLFDDEDAYETRFSIFQNLSSHYYKDLSAKCGVVCKKDKILNSLYNSSNHLADEFEQNLRLLYSSESAEMTLLDEKTRSYLKSTCPEGYTNYNEYICVPCDRGYYRLAGEKFTKCEKCGAFSYQETIAQTGCIGCGKFKLTAMYGAKEIEDCMYFYKSWIAMLIIIPCTLVAIFLSFFVCKFLIFFIYRVIVPCIRILSKIISLSSGGTTAHKSTKARIGADGMAESTKLLMRKRPGTEHRSRAQKSFVDKSKHTSEYLHLKDTTVPMHVRHSPHFRAQQHSGYTTSTSSQSNLSSMS